jgi:cobalt-zinc-cadmium efflux system outer membrane protein
MDSNRATPLVVSLVIAGVLAHVAVAASEAADNSPETARVYTGASEEPQGELTLRVALSLALKHNAELAAFSQEVRAAEAAVIQAGVFPNPKLEIVGDNLGNARKRQEGDQSTSLLIGQLIELGGKRTARVRLAETGRELAGWDYEAKRVEVLARVRQAFVETLVAQQRTALADESVRLAQAVADAVAKRVQAGKVAPVEETKARLTLSATLVEREQARRELAAARKRLTALWSNPEPRFDRAAGDLESVPTLPAFETLAARVRDNPGLARWTTDVQRRQAGVEAERAKAVPDITVSGGVSRFSEFNDHAYIVGISIPIPVFDQNRGGILEANRRLDKAADERRAVESRLLAELSDAYQRTAAVANEIERLRTDLLPGSQSAFDAATQGYQLGKFGFLDVLDAQRTLFHVRTQYLRALGDYHLGVSEIERLTGAALDGTAPNERKGQ